MSFWIFNSVSLCSCRFVFVVDFFECAIFFTGIFSIVSSHKCLPLEYHRRIRLLHFVDLFQFGLYFIIELRVYGTAVALPLGMYVEFGF